MRLVAVANEKGGVGKTTTTMSLAAVAAESNRVLVVDIDPQPSSSLWWAEQGEDGGDGLPFDVVAETDASLLGQIRNLPDYDVVFIDTPGSLENGGLIRAVVQQCDYVILPSAPAALSYPSLFRTIREIIAPTEVPYRVLINMMDSSRKGTVKEVFEALDENGVPHFQTPVRRYAAHERAPESGIVVTQYPRNRDTRNAIDDYRKVAMELFSEWSRAGRNGRPVVKAVG